jgi:hypothetical protein
MIDVLVIALLMVGVSASTIGPLAFDIAGGNAQRRYLVLAENPAELRPAGGYAGTVGIVTLDHFKLVDKTFVDVYAIDLRSKAPFQQPPDALANHLLGDQSWQLADSAWSPDFPTSAQNALRLYSLETGDSNIDGVIAINTFAIDKLLEVTGPVNVPTYDVTVNPGDTTLTALGLTRGVSSLNSNRKAFLNDLAAQILDRIQHPGPLEISRLPNAVSQMLADRSVMIWLKDPAEQQRVAAQGFDGRVRQDGGDYLYVVEANVEPSSKYNLVVDRTDDLSVQLDSSGNASSQLQMTWQNNAMDDGEPYQSLRAYSTNQVGLYGDYVRVLTPGSATLSSASGQGDQPIDQAEEVSTEANRAVFGNYLLTPPGKSALEYAWSTTGVATQASSGDWTYRLTVQKEPGALPSQFAAQITLPAGATIESTPPGATTNGETVAIAANLANDAQFEVRYRL